jgi:predicted nucleotidyltransferase
VRDDATPVSDVDLFIDYDRTSGFSLIELVGIKQMLEDRLGMDVDIGNVLRHEYHRVSDTIVWNVVQRHLAPLKDAVAHSDATLDEDQAGGGI